ncbi:MAG: putative porin, partial [Vicinamibacterales bacterium]
ESGQANDSGNQTFENGFDDFAIFIARAYLGWQPNDWLNVTLGKVKNPFYTTDMIWDSDINPQGLVETIAFHKMPWAGGAAGPTGDFLKDGTSFAPSEVRSLPPWELTLVAGQLFYDDNNEFNLDSDLNTDAYLFVEQLIATWKFNSNTSITIAPAFYTFTAADVTGLVNENPFTDAGDSTRPIPVTQTTVTGRDRVVYSYNAAGALTGAVVTRRETTAVQTSQPTATANGNSTVTRVADTRERVTSSRALTAAQATARAQQTGVATNLGAGTAGRTTQTDDDNVNVLTTSSTANRFPAVSGETRQLHILTAPGDISFKIGGLKTKVYWDFAYNFGGRERFEDIYQLYNGGAPGEPRTRYNERDGIAWLVGLQLGETRKKGDWQAFLTYRETGIASIDPNLNDSDFALGELNTRGFKGGIAYAFSDAVVLNITGYLAWNLSKDLQGGRATNAPVAVADANSVNTLQVDLNIKF